MVLPSRPYQPTNLPTNTFPAESSNGRSIDPTASPKGSPIPEFPISGFNVDSEWNFSSPSFQATYSSTPLRPARPPATLQSPRYEMEPRHDQTS